MGTAGRIDRRSVLGCLVGVLTLVGAAACSSEENAGGAQAPRSQQTEELLDESTGPGDEDSETLDDDLEEAPEDDGAVADTEPLGPWSDTGVALPDVLVGQWCGGKDGLNAVWTFSPNGCLTSKSSQATFEGVAWIGEDGAMHWVRALADLVEQSPIAIEVHEGELSAAGVDVGGNGDVLYLDGYS